MKETANELISKAKQELMRGKHHAGIGYLQYVLADHPENVDALELMGIAYEQAGCRQRAIDILSRVTQLAPGRASGHYNLALILAEDKDKLDDAIEENQTALVIKKDHAGALDLQAKLNRRLNDRNWRSDENFAVVEGDGQRLNNPEASWSKLICENCGAMNFVTARTCSRCGIYLHGEKEVIPME